MYLNNIVKKIIHKLKRKKSEYGFSGNYVSWEDAMSHCSGYDKKNILEKTFNSIQKVKNSEFPYERDSVLFDHVQYSWPLLSGLLYVSTKNNCSLNILDFGGSLGSTYFQNIKFLQQLKKLKWNIVEQPHYVECGKKNLENKNLKFFSSIEDCLKKNKIDVIIFSSVLQYLADPNEFIKTFLSKRIRYIIIDLTGFIIENGLGRLTIQKVPPQIYDASYPVWFFNEKTFIELFLQNYNLLVDFPGYVGEIINIDNKPIAGYKGFLFELKE